MTTCRHPSRSRVAGPRLPLRWGSAATLVCRRCWRWSRFDDYAPRLRWRPAAELVEALIPEDES